MNQFTRTKRALPTGNAVKGLMVTALAVLMLAGCASSPQPPDREIQAADIAINSAEQARVANYAALELDQARVKVAAARVAVLEQNMLLARQLAEESLVNAELATARAEMLRAQEVNADLQSSIDSLKQEILRNTGTRQ